VASRFLKPETHHREFIVRQAAYRLENNRFSIAGFPTSLAEPEPSASSMHIKILRGYYNKFICLFLTLA